ncbi:MAG: clostripain-related cysteine peptidase [Eubacteriales bacterium]|nr:clostripain-related cysteine peptidase [Eubacteriales bacterium]
MRKKQLSRLVLTTALLVSAVSGGCAKRTVQPAAGAAEESAESTIVNTQNGTGEDGEQAASEEAEAEVIDTSGFRYHDSFRETETPMGEADTWSLFIYMCGSDLEADNGSATWNLMQIMDAVPSDRVNVIVQTGGSEAWGDTERWTENLSQEVVDAYLEMWGTTAEALETAKIDPEKLQRYRLTDTMELVDEEPLASMGDPDTLYDFLSWGVENYPAEHMGVILWDHGGGSLIGACVDKLFDDDIMYPFEIGEAFEQLAPEMTDRFEFIGFDACLMASLETANILAPHARYLYASEEVEPGFGWDYGPVINELNEKPEMEGAELGEILCNAFMAFYREWEMQDSVTLSVTDLSKIDPVLAALDEITGEIELLTEEPKYLGLIARETARAESYQSPGMIDLGDVASNLSAMIPEAGNALLTAVEDAVVYSVSGQARSFATGLSVYYPTEYNMNGVLMYEYSAPTDIYAEYVRSLHDGQLRQKLADKPLVKIEGEPVYAEDGSYQMNIDPDTLDYVREAGHLLFADAGDGMSLYYGNSNDVEIDFTTGTVRDQFDGAWAFLEGEPLMLELDEYFDEYAIFLSPIVLNGNHTNLVVQWTWNEEEEYGGHYDILGTYAGVDPETGLSSRSMRKLQSGDVVKPLYAIVSNEDVLSEEDVEFSEETMEVVTGASIMIGREPQIECLRLDEEDTYYYQFYVIDIYGSQQTFVPTEMHLGETEEGDDTEITEDAAEADAA